MVYTLIGYLREIFGDKEEPEIIHEVIVRRHKGSRTLAQNALSHVWYKQVADYEQADVGEVKDFCKLTFGVPLLICVDAEFRDFYFLAFSHLDYVQQLKAITYVNVTSLMDPEVMSEYLRNMERFYAMSGLQLTRTHDYDEAMQ